jgi:hypothetical protein
MTLGRHLEEDRHVTAGPPGVRRPTAIFAAALLTLISACAIITSVRSKARDLVPVVAKPVCSRPTATQASCLSLIVKHNAYGVASPRTGLSPAG